MSNLLMIAAAGAGKTSYLVKKALEIKDKPVLITTFTIANEAEIRQKIITENAGSIPPNITIQTWFSLMLEHGVKPYQSYLYDEKVNGLMLVNSRSGYRFTTRYGQPVYWGDDKVQYHYFNKNNQIFSDKLTKFVVKCDELSGGKVIRRLSKLYQHIFVDEVQDMAGYDLDVLKLLMASESDMLLVGDPRQVTYLTHLESKYTKYRNGKIKDFIQNECKKIQCDIDETTLSVSHRNTEAICALSSKLYPEYSKTSSGHSKITGHDGVFIVDEKDLSAYLKAYAPIQIRLRIDSKGPDINYPAMSFGESKGLTFERVIIFPTDDMKKWLVNNSITMKDQTKAQFYVGLTRPIHSVAIFNAKTKIGLPEGAVAWTP